MKTKLVKRITSCSFFACALVSLVAAMALGANRFAAAGPAAPDAPGCSVGTLKGLYLSSWDGYAIIGENLVPKAVMEGKRFNGDGTFGNDFGTVNIGGTTIINTAGWEEPIRSHRTAREPCQSPTAQPLTCTSDRVHRRFGSPRLRED